MTEATWTPALVATAVLSVALTSVLWWTYFPRARPVLEHALVASEGAAQSKMARDVYSLLHFLMLAGVILYAVAVEEAIAHPGEPLPFAGRLALGLGVFLFVGGMGAAIRRATGRLLGTRWLVPAIAALAIILVGAVANLWSLVLALAGIAAVALLEERGEGLRP